ncbi:Uncharacterized protein M6B38_241760 [Iris pallida]|uniref:Uncharacterized protein n=1 Tax=Iris pallida TaxID=29817 RepID=A0AAX6DJI7_IRIPA|nr:Uncharacterized protein M6B38_241760 [Iris pallida]
MNSRVRRTTLQSMKPIPKHDKETEKEKKAEMMQGTRRLNRIQSRRERKIALQQDVDKLKKKLRHEENVHRALERAFTRPLGALPRLPPYLPSNILELLAEVAVLEEEVVRLEEQVVNFRQGLYQEAVYISSSKKTKENESDSSQNSNPIAPVVANPSPSTGWSSNGDPNEPSTNRLANGRHTPKKANADDRRGKENQISTNTTKNRKQSPAKNVPRTRMAAVPPDVQRFCSISEEVPTPDKASSGPNKLSEDILVCLLSIFSQMSSSNNTMGELGALPSVLGSCEGIGLKDPYGICSEFGRRDIGQYKHFVSVEPVTIDPNLALASSFLSRRLKVLLRKLVIVELSGLTHHQKLAFWINIYNACMMNTFLENGIPATPQMFVTLLPKAMVNVGGNLLTAMTIEHFILRKPYHSRSAYSKGAKSDDMAKTRGVLGLDWPEPLVTFALSCGSWSSPAVRVYTASQVEKQLETAKRDYLQASIGISMPDRMAIPKLLDWYLLDFAKDVESLMDWICLQLPSELRNDAVRCLEAGRRSVVPTPIQVLPYDFRFRYLLAP